MSIVKFVSYSIPQMHLIPIYFAIKRDYGQTMMMMLMITIITKYINKKHTLHHRKLILCIVSQPVMCGSTLCAALSTRPTSISRKAKHTGVDHIQQTPQITLFLTHTVANIQIHKHIHSPNDTRRDVPCERASPPPQRKKVVHI